MEPVVTVVIVDCVDWQGLYVNGELAWDDHRISLNDFYHAVKGKTIQMFYRSANPGLEDYLEACGQLPFSFLRCEELGIR